LLAARAFVGSHSQAGSIGSLRSPSVVARRAGIVDKISNPVRTVSDTEVQFYKEYPQPPLLPMYRPFIRDLMTQTHLYMFDSTFKYDVVFGLGFRENFMGTMGSYDKIVNSAQAENIFAALCTALGMDAPKVIADGEIVAAYAKSASPADILKALDGSAKASDPKVAEAFAGIKKSLYSTSFSVGLFKIMELTDVEVSKTNVEEWAKALGIKESKLTGDLQVYRDNQGKLKAAEEMIREVEIREKKKLAERLEQKAKALAAKAAAKSAEK